MPTVAAATSAAVVKAPPPSPFFFLAISASVPHAESTRDSGTRSRFATIA
jgi:hypothetical protein